MQPPAKFWNKAAAKYAKSKIENVDAYNYTLDRTRSHLNADDKVLEVGCGTGSTALDLASDVEHITASDLSANMIAIAIQKARDQQIENITFVTADMFDETLANGRYDAVLALNVLHLVEDLPAAVRRINDLLNPGGIFISKTVCLNSGGMSLKFRIMMTILPLMQFLNKAPYVNKMAPDELERTFTAEGFKIIEAGDHPPPSRYIVAQKTGNGAR